MSKIEELIEGLCPEGVEFRRLGEICEMRKGVQFNKKDMAETGSYPVINGGINPSGYIEQYNESENTITVSQGGASAGYVNWQKVRFWAGAHCYVIRPLNSAALSNRYLYFFVKNNERDLQQCQYGAGIPALGRKELDNLSIPLPPLAVQEEIVRILDAFTSLEAELEAELEARKKQYAYYRDTLLSFDSDDPKVEWKRLGEVVRGISSGKNKTRNNEGQYPVYGSTGIIAKTDEYVYDKKQILIARVGAYAGYVHIADCKYDVSDNAIIVDLKDEVSFKYIYHLLTNLGLNKFAKGGGQPLVTASQMKQISIPLPPLSVQHCIAETLDKFEALTSDLQSGLPAEIEARRKQYEYYRDRLLTFKVKSDE